jgi:hypothetical protein
MALSRKCLWIVNMDTQATESLFAKHALAIGATGVCIRTSSKRMPGSIATFKKLGFQVYAWRWPSVVPKINAAEANNVANNLIPAGLDGYIVDPESDGPGSNDWNQPSLEPLAKSFCNTIKKAAGSRFVFGTTSGCAYPGKDGKADIPWKEFFAASDVLFPQTYWRWTYNDKKLKKNVVQDINGGTPSKSIDRGLTAWQPKSQGKPIVPMAGEVDVVTPKEIASYGAELVKLNVTEGHFYTDNGKIPLLNLAAMQAL